MTSRAWTEEISIRTTDNNFYYLCSLMSKLFIFIVFSMLLTACHTRSGSHEEDVLYQLETVCQQQRDSVLSILDTLSTDRLSQKEKAHYCLLRVITTSDPRFSEPLSDSLIDEAFRYFSQHRKDEAYYYALTNFYASSIQRAKGDVAKTAWHFLEGAEAIEKCTTVDERLIRYAPGPTDVQNEIDRVKYAIYMRLGSFITSYSFWDDGLYYLRPANRYYQERHKDNLRIRALTRMGYAYCGKHDTDSALYCLNDAWNLARRLHDNYEFYFISDAIANTYLVKYEDLPETEQADNDTLLSLAIAYGRCGLDSLATLGQDYLDRIASGTHAKQSYAYWLTGQYDSCLYYASLVTASPFSDDGTRQWAERNLFRVYNALGQNAEANVHAAFCIENYKNETRHSVQMEVMNLDRIKEKRYFEEEQYKSSREIWKFEVYLLMLLSIIGLTIAYFLYFRYKKQQQLEILRFQSEQRELEFNLANQRLTSFVEFSKRMKRIYDKGASKGANEEAFKQIMAELNNRYPEIIPHLKSAYPDLNEAEVHIIILCGLSFLIKDMAQLLGFSENTVGKYRSNIRKKTGCAKISELVMPLFQ